jgi:hypothetical protein
MKQKLIDQLLHKAGARFGAEGTDYSDFTLNFNLWAIKSIHLFLDFFFMS